MPEDTYTIYVKGYYGTDTSSCINIIDSSKGLDMGTVYPPQSVPWIPNELISICPNPASEYIIISLPGHLRAERVVLQDMSGRVLKEGNENRLAIAELPTGIYVIQVQAGNSRFVRRLIKADQ